MSPKAKTEPLEEVAKTADLPKPTDPEWNDYVLSHLTPEELLNGNPTTDGLRRIAPLVLQTSVVGRAHVVQAPNKPNGMVATVEYTVTAGIITFPGTGHGLVETVVECADASPENCEIPYSLHPSAMAATRAEGRALRKLLKLRRVTTAEEVAIPSTQSVKTEDGTPYYIQFNQYTALNTLFKKTDLNGKKYIDKYTEKYHSTKYENPGEIPYTVAIELIKHVQKWNQGKNPDDLPVPPEDVQGYDSSFMTDWVVS